MFLFKNSFILIGILLSFISFKFRSWYSEGSLFCHNIGSSFLKGSFPTWRGEAFLVFHGRRVNLVLFLFCLILRILIAFKFLKVFLVVRVPSHGTLTSSSSGGFSSCVGSPTSASGSKHHVFSLLSASLLRIEECLIDTGLSRRAEDIWHVLSLCV